MNKQTEGLIHNLSSWCVFVAWADAYIPKLKTQSDRGKSIPTFSYTVSSISASTWLKKKKSLTELPCVPRTGWWSRRFALVPSTSGWSSPRRRCPEWSPVEQHLALWEIIKHTFVSLKTQPEAERRFLRQESKKKSKQQDVLDAFLFPPSILFFFLFHLLFPKLKMLSIQIGWKLFRLRFFFSFSIYDLPSPAPHADVHKTINKRAFQGPTVHKWPWAKVKHIITGMCEIIWSHRRYKNNTHTTWDMFNSKTEHVSRR